MSILGILIICVGILIGSTIKFKKKRDYTSTLKLDVVIINIEEGGDGDLSDFDNKKNKKKIKFSKLDKYYSE